MNNFNSINSFHLNNKSYNHDSDYPNQLNQKPSNLSDVKKKVRNEEKEIQKAENDLNGRMVICLGVVGAAIVATVAAIALYEAASLIYEIAQDKIWKPDLEKLKSKAKEKFSFELVKKFESIKGIDTTRLFKRLSLCKEDEQEIFNHLVENFDLTDYQLQEILMGAHIRLDDNGEMFEEWMKKLESKKQRISSHPSNSNQYGVRGPLVKELLFSCVKENGKQYTWFQLENNPVTFGHIIRHLIDYVKYKLSGENQGPDGSSKATHHNPITIKRKV